LPTPLRRSSTTGSPVGRRLIGLIAGDGPLSVTEPVVMEVLAGARSDEREAKLRRMLLRLRLLTFDAGADFDGAVRIYRRCRHGLRSCAGWCSWRSAPG
jgi:hypothetical protein